jgi:hypothetical protein
MLITRTSIVSGIERTLDLDITEAQLARLASGVLIQDALPHLSNTEREFFLTGMTDDEWDNLFGEDDE